MKNFFIVGLAAATIYLLYRNYQLNQTINSPASATSIVNASRVAASPQLNLAPQVITPQTELVPDVMYQQYDAEVLPKFPWT